MDNPGAQSPFLAFMNRPSLRDARALSNLRDSNRLLGRDAPSEDGHDYIIA